MFGIGVGSAVGFAVGLTVGWAVGVVVGTDVGCNGDMQTVKPARDSFVRVNHVILVPTFTGTLSGTAPAPPRTPE